MTTQFRKMHGLGNDFVVIDARRAPFAAGRAARAWIADRRRGVGCDQLIVVEPPADASADATMRIYNPDGGEAQACGNATRCVADLLMAESGAERAIIATVAGRLAATRLADGRISVDMGPAALDWREIPLARAMDTLDLGLAHGPFRGGTAVGMGNPHVVFVVPDAETAPIATLGPAIEHDPLFPERTNVEAIQILARDRIRMRVWERSAGLTAACGSGACAALVAAVRLGLADRQATLVLDGGELEIAWRPDGRVTMAGPVAYAFAGELPAETTGQDLPT